MVKYSLVGHLSYLARLGHWIRFPAWSAAIGRSFLVRTEDG
jgi:hypothetical protein